MTSRKILTLAQRIVSPKTLAFLAGACVSLLISGCGTSQPTTQISTALAAMNGAVHGGQSPIQNATVTLYVTQASATGYGQAATIVGSATTDSGGNFVIAPSATAADCPAGQQAYLTAAGGYQSGQSGLTNTSMLQMAALGDCANIGANTFVILNEVTTVAAAYALSGFTTTTLNATSGLYQANVSAPAANNSPAGSATAQAPAGLAHAFLNAANLVNYSTGMPRTTVSVNGAGTTEAGSVPYVEILTLADIMQSCIDGSTGNANCSGLFGFTPSIAGVASGNTLQAFLNLARNPYPSTAAMDPSSGLLGLVHSTAAFQPTLAAAPTDWTLSIVYGAESLPAGYGVTLDAGDTVYVGSSAVSSSIPALVGLSAYGNTPPAFATLPAGTTTTGIAADALGNIWVANAATGLYQYPTTTSGSAITSSPTSFTTLNFAYGVAVDAANNVWVGHALAPGANIDEFAYSAGAWTQKYTASAPAGVNGIAVDGSQNIWGAPYYVSTSGNVTQAMMIPNAGTAVAPVYSPSVQGGTVLNSLAATLAGGATEPFGVVFDASGNAWYDIYGTANYSTAGIEEVVPNAHTGATALTPQAFISGTTAGSNAQSNILGTSDALLGAIDGAGTLFIPDNNDPTFGIHVYLTQTNTAGGTQILSPFHGYKSCYLPTSTSTICGTSNSAAVYNAQQLAIDSTGSIWAPLGSGGVTQIIGAAAPSYPLLSAGKPGLSPGLTSVIPLP